METFAGVETSMKRKQKIGIITLIAAFFAMWGVQAKVSLAAQGREARGATGEITGKVEYEGARPKLREIYMNRDPECMRENQGRTVYVQDGAVNGNGTLPNVFVYAKTGGSGQSAVPRKPVVLDQQGCIFVPHVLGIMVGQTLKVLNSDFTMHNVHVTPKDNPQWNESQPPGAAPLYKKFGNPEIMIPVSCNEHPWMKAYIGVVKNPYYGVTGTTGRYTIKGIPAGEYTIEAWTATFGTQEKTVRVRPHATTTLDFTFQQR
jgi:plastocyanin